MRRILTKLKKPVLAGIYGFSIAHFFGEYIGCFIYCQGDSMLPTLRNGDLVWSSRCHNLASPRIKVGDIVCLVNPMEPSGSVMKRIMAIRKERPSGPMEVEVQGDNRGNSIDSRHYGPVPLGLVRYKAEYRVYPLERRGCLN